MTRELGIKKIKYETWLGKKSKKKKTAEAITNPFTLNEDLQRECNSKTKSIGPPFANAIVGITA